MALFIASLSNIYGIRNVLVFCWILFIGFSAACAQAKTMVAL
jgi:hypothetical protein